MTDYLLKRTGMTSDISAFVHRCPLCRFSAPTVMISDQGKGFCNELFNRLCALWDVDKRRMSPYHPQTNSSAESYNRSMRKYITVMLDNNPTMDLEDLLPSMMLSYNCHVHRATGDRPFFLTFAHDPRLPFSAEGKQPAEADAQAAAQAERERARSHSVTEAGGESSQGSQGSRTRRGAG
jgi:transposase InsO family protein